MAGSPRTELGKRIKQAERDSLVGKDNSSRDRTIEAEIIRMVPANGKEYLYYAYCVEKIRTFKNGKYDWKDGRRFSTPIKIEDSISNLAADYGAAEHLQEGSTSDSSKQKRRYWCIIKYSGIRPEAGTIIKIKDAPGNSLETHLLANSTAHKGVTFAEPQGGMFG